MVATSSDADAQKAASAFPPSDLFMTKSFVRSLFSFSKLEVNHAFKNARKVAQIKGFTLLQAPLFNKEMGSILIIIPRKAGKAHDRNKLRRQIREIFYKEKLYEKPVTSILLVYEHAKNLSFDEIKNFLISIR